MDMNAALLPSQRAGFRRIATGDFTMVKMPAAPALSGLVRDFTLYREHAPGPIRQTETASFTIPLLIGFSEPFDIALGRDPGRDDAYVSFTSGLCLKPVHIRSMGGCTCLEITLTPPGARAFLGMPMSDLTERMVALDELGDRTLDRLRQKLGEEDDWDRRLEIAEAFTLDRLARARAPSAAIRWSYETILARGGNVSVGSLADRLEMSRKHLAHRFREEVGMPPKAVARVARFMKVQALARAGTGEGWAGIAAACGYADQAHMAREFRELAGTTPTLWRAAQSAPG